MKHVIQKNLPRLILKPGREKSVRNKHPWIFSGAVHTLEKCANGSLVQVLDCKEQLLGTGYCNTKSQIVCRMISFDGREPMTALYEHIQEAITLRRSLNMHRENTNAYRLIAADGDFLPGLIVDKYDDTLVIQIGTLGMERLKPAVVEILQELEKPAWIYEKSQAPSRSEEGMKPQCQTLFGIEKEIATVSENGISFLVDIKKGQKTGFFLDQQAMRLLVHDIAKDRKVLNCFSYTGGFSLYALKGGAQFCDSVDISTEAIALTETTMSSNDFVGTNHREIAEDVFSFLRTDTTQYDCIILDPPAFAKKKSDVAKALRGYRDINRIAMERLPPGGLLLTASCSYHVDHMLFKKTLFAAACEAKRNVRILESHRHAYDHPQSLFCPEGDYLKSFLLYVT